MADAAEVDARGTETVETVDMVETGDLMEMGAMVDMVDAVSAGVATPVVAPPRGATLGYSPPQGQHLGASVVEFGSTQMPQRSYHVSQGGARQRGGEERVLQTR